ncbi:cellulase family glycosylhydrolase [Sphaerotilus sp.]|uniref:cellulase family glycosylhydrolase n=1 Tax=Sphaerotilus sp. TaxID=2093942 RepID=UPI0034E2168E
MKPALTLAAAVLCSALAHAADTYTVSGTQILHNGNPQTFRGANAMHVFGGSPTEMANWNVDIVRVFIGAMRDTPLTGGPVQVGTSWLRSVQALIDANRAAGKVTILCPFGWDGTAGSMFTGMTPSAQYFYGAYKTKMRDWAMLVKNQPDVWLEVWNEPYWWNNGNGYSDALWLSDMKTMVDNIRSTGATNIVVVPGNRQGQGEDVLLTQGRNLLAGRSNLVFDLHAYERWLEGSGEPNTDLASVETRIQSVRGKGLAVLFGEIGPMNAGALMNPATFLKAARRQNLTTTAWLWKYSSTDKDALLDGAGNPNNNGNNAWGSSVLNFTTGLRGAGLAADGDTSTRWTTGTAQQNGQSLTVSLGTGRSWNHLRMDMGAWSQEYPRGYKVLVSNDAVTWTEKASGAGTAWVTDIWPGPQWSKFVRIVQTGSATVPWSIAELEVRQD